MGLETPVLVWTLQGLFCSEVLDFCLVYNYRLKILFSENMLCSTNEKLLCAETA